MPKISGANLADHRQRTWNALLDAVDDVVAERGFDAASLRDIGARAGIARTAIYNYAPDKNALLLAAIERAVAPMRLAVRAVVEQRDEPALDRLERVVHFLLDLPGPSAQLLHLARSIDDSESVAAHADAKSRAQSEIQQHLDRLLREGIEDGSVPAAINVGLLVAVIAAVLDAAMMRALLVPAEAAQIRTQTAEFLRSAMARPVTKV